MEGSRWTPRRAGVAAVVGGTVVFLTMALATGQPVLGFAVALPFAGFVWLAWRRGGLGWRLRKRLLDNVPPAKHRPFRRDPWKKIDEGRWP